MPKLAKLAILYERTNLIRVNINDAPNFLKAKLFYNDGWSVRPGKLALFDNLSRLELSYRF